jgi:hypothetical protein
LDFAVTLQAEDRSWRYKVVPFFGGFFGSGVQQICQEVRENTAENRKLPGGQRKGWD